MSDGPHLGAERLFELEGQIREAEQRVGERMQLLVRLLDRKPPDPAAALLAAMAVDTAVVRERLGTSPPQP